MTTDEELRAAAASLRESVLVVGCGDAGAVAADVVADADVPATDDASAPDAVVLAVDGAAPPGAVPDAVVDAPLTVAVVSLASRPQRTERELLAALSGLVDATVVVADNGEAALADAVETFVSVVRDPGFVNLDLADARTVLVPIEQAVLGVGTSERGVPGEAVDAAFATLPAGVGTDAAEGVLVDLLGGPSMSVADVSDAVTAVRGRVGPDAHVIWGGGVDASLEAGVQVRLVVAGVSNVRAAPGDPCPRCGSSLSAYTLGARWTLSCDDCGFAGVSVRLRE